MAEYLPLHAPGRAFTRTTSGAVTGGQLLIVSGSGTVAAASAGTLAWVGVAAADQATTGGTVGVFAGGIQRIIAGTGGVTAGVLVEPATGGTVVAHTPGTNDLYVVGLALTTATATNLVEVQMER